MFFKFLPVLTSVVLLTGFTSSPSFASPTSVQTGTSFNTVSIESERADSWVELTNKVVSELNEALKVFVSTLTPGIEPSPEQLDEFDNLLDTIHSNNNFEYAYYESGVLTPGLFWGEPNNSSALYLSRVSGDVSCVSEISVGSSEDDPLTEVFLVPSSISCVPTSTRGSDLARVEATNMAESIRRNALTLAAFEDSRVTPKIIAKIVNESSGFFVKPSQKFLKNKGVFKTDVFTVRSFNKNSYKVSYKVSLPQNYSYTCSFSFTGKSLKISPPVCN